MINWGHLTYWLEKNDFYYYIGWLERNNAIEKSDPSIVSHKEQFSVSMFDSQFKEKIKEENNSYLENLKRDKFNPSLTNILFNFNEDHKNSDVIELTSGYDFMMEGRTMKHCVEGLFHTCKSRLNYVLHINSKKGSTGKFFLSTLEISLQKNSMDYVFAKMNEHKGYSNDEPYELNNTLAMEILKRINTQLELIQKNKHTNNDCVSSHKKALKSTMDRLF